MGFLEKLLGRADQDEDDLANLDGAAKEMIQGVVELSQSAVKEIMVPRPDVISVPLDVPSDKLLELVAQSGHSRLPVYHQNMDNIVGVVYAKDLLRAQVSVAGEPAEDAVLDRIMRRPYFVPETKKVDQLLREFQLRRVHIAVVVDEYGGTSGIVCLEDVIEEIVGDIQDEFDDEAEEILKIGEGIYLCDARVRLDELNEYAGFDLPADSFETPRRLRVRPVREDPGEVRKGALRKGGFRHSANGGQPHQQRQDRDPPRVSVDGRCRTVGEGGVHDIRTMAALDLAGRRVLIRVDFNVPLAGAEVADDTRIRAALPTIAAVLDRPGARVVLMSHLGRPKGVRRPGLSLAPVAVRLAALLERPVEMAPDCIGPEVERRVAALPAGGVLLLENLRFHAAEEAGDAGFARQLAALGDAYVNDAFGAAHRAHASTAAVAGYLPSAAGLLMEREVATLGDLLETPRRPFVAIVGGAKVSSKVAVLGHLLAKVDTLLIGGAMAYTFLAAGGTAVGNSLVERELTVAARTLVGRAGELGVRLLLPCDHVTADAVAADATRGVTDGADIPSGGIGVDIGPRTVAAFGAAIADAGTVLWNGPMGVFEGGAVRGRHVCRGGGGSRVRRHHRGGWRRLGSGDQRRRGRRPDSARIHRRGRVPGTA